MRPRISDSHADLRELFFEVLVVSRRGLYYHRGEVGWFETILDSTSRGAFYRTVEEAEGLHGRVEGVARTR